MQRPQSSKPEIGDPANSPSLEASVRPQILKQDGGDTHGGLSLLIVFEIAHFNTWPDS